jgi:subtilisin family serine protease
VSGPGRTFGVCPHPRSKGETVSLPEVVYAQASPRSQGGTSLFDGGAAVTADAVEDFFSERAVTREAADSLRAAGFEVLQVSPTTINIAGPPDLYAEAFKTTLETHERPVIKEGRREDTATFIDSPDTDQRGLIDTSGTSLGDAIEGVAIEEPKYYMAANAFPPNRSYWYLDVPGGISLGLNADRVHRLSAVTGRGVKLMMVDSGWFEHPYFTRRGYRHAVRLGPGATAPQHDESGHGTGESANAFAAAPDIDFTMVKMNFANSTGSFNAAVTQAPHVISCSWGSSIQQGPLSAADQALAAAIAAAVARGIIVVFSAGNGHWGFPGQHPDVISAGGVYMDEQGRLQASNYSSGFASQIYSGRKCPDASGLVGMTPAAAYIMLPIEPGDEIDTTRAGGAFPAKDETAPNDGWSTFSGTSAAAPQLAGVCALLKQANPAITPAQARKALKDTARDVTAGTGALGQQARPGYDLATGAGLVDAEAAVRAASQLAVGHADPAPAGAG